jgi:hypothetical protein
VIAAFPSVKVNTEGAMWIESAPDVASFPLAWLTSNDRAAGFIRTKRDLVIFLPTGADPLMYRITSYNTETHRFEGTKI